MKTLSSPGPAFQGQPSLQGATLKDLSNSLTTLFETFFRLEKHQPQPVLAIPVNAPVCSLTKREAFEQMLTTNQHWTNIDTPLGKLHYSLQQVVFTGLTALPAYVPSLQSPASEVHNATASSLAGFEVFGGCFLEAAL